MLTEMQGNQGNAEGNLGETPAACPPFARWKATKVVVAATVD
jgi:hypothetical protein